MPIKNKLLFVGGLCSAVASALHIAIIIGGADWYRFFGAGEEMAQLAEKNAIYPTVVTSIIALVLAIWALYGFSGAGIIKKLPLLKAGLYAISAVYLLRGLAGLPLVFFVDHEYLNELANRKTFMLVSSLICIVFGLCYLIGAKQIWVKTTKKSQLNTSINE